jgi:hypothetical protein
MALKFDLLTKLATDKYLCEIELIDTANSTTMPYREKLYRTENILGEIIIINAKIDMADKYLVIPETPEPQPEKTSNE